MLRGASNSPGSSFGPSARLGGSTRDFTQGLYNSLGALLGAGKTPTNPGKDSPQARRRAEILNEAATLIDLGDSAGGRALAQGLLKKNSRDVTALRLVGHSFLNERDYKQAERSYGQALAFASGNPTLQGELNTARTLQKSDDEVLKQGRRLIQAPTRRAEGLQLLARLTDRS
ncbi:MAG: tetratricopeptide repeat protein, partial [Phycisphaerae bacterium]